MEKRCVAEESFFVLFCQTILVIHEWVCECKRKEQVSVGLVSPFLLQGESCRVGEVSFCTVLVIGKAVIGRSLKT